MSPGGFASELEKIAHGQELQAYYVPGHKPGSPSKDYAGGALRGGLTGAALAGLYTSIRSQKALRASLPLVRGMTGAGAALGVANAHHERTRNRHQPGQILYKLAGLGFIAPVVRGNSASPGMPQSSSPGVLANASKSRGTTDSRWDIRTRQAPHVGQRFMAGG